MHHLYPLAKGDPMCPLGFHPQVRWPTRCKRCFRDYKEHGGKKKEDDFTASTPSLSTWSSAASRNREELNGIDRDKAGRSWSSSQNLSPHEAAKEKSAKHLSVSRSNTSWTSTPDLNASEVATAVTVSLKLPIRRRQTAPLDTGQTDNDTPNQSTVVLKKPPTPAHLTINKNDSLAERHRKMQLLKKQNSIDKERDDKEKEKERERRSVSKSRAEEQTKDDLNFLMQVKKVTNDVKSLSNNVTKKPPIKVTLSRESDPSDDESTTGTFCSANTDVTLVSPQYRDYQDQIESLKSEVDTLKKRCERVEKEKSDILLRRLANIDTPASKVGTRSSEVIKLQQKINDLTTQNEDLRDEKKILTIRIAEIEAELENRPSVEAANRQVEQLRSKLLAAETLCEELMDENEDMKKELRELEEEIEEMQDNFREDQADEYTTLRRDIEQTTKNCRVLSFKLKKTERRAEQLEQEKTEQEKKLLELAGGKAGLDRLERIKELEQELSRSNEVAMRLQRELQEANARAQQPAAQKRNPSLAVIGKVPSTEGKVSRASLTRGGSQEEPQQLLRDLQDSLEREADLREQLRNAEEEANNLRKRASRLEDDNESLLLQLKKMATKARTRKLSPTPPTNRLSIESSLEKDEGISDEEDPAELRILLELNEQEAAVLRRKVEELEQENDSLKRQLKESNAKIVAASSKPAAAITNNKKNTKAGNLAEEKNKVLEDEISELRIKLIEKDRSCERLHAELSLAQSKSKGFLMKSKSLDGNTEQQNVDLKRQLQVIEQEASVLRSKTQSLELDNEKLNIENKRLQLLRNAKNVKSDKSIEINLEKITSLEKQLKEAHVKLKEFESVGDKTEKRVGFADNKDGDALKAKQEECHKLKLNFDKLDKENKRLTITLKELKEEAITSFKPRVPKKLTDLTTKLQMKKIVEELESEIGELYVIMKNAKVDLSVPSKQPAAGKELENLREKLSKTESELTTEKNKLISEIAKLKEMNSKLESDKTNLLEKCKKSDEEMAYILDENKLLQHDKKKLENQVNKLCGDLKASSTKQTAMADCMKKIEELKVAIETKDKELDKLKKVVEINKSLEQDKGKLIKEAGDKAKKITELEKKLKESEDRAKRAEKQVTVRKERVTKLEKELAEEKEQKEAISNGQKGQLTELLTKKEELETNLNNAEEKLTRLESEGKLNEAKLLKFQSDLREKDVQIKQLLSKNTEPVGWISERQDLQTNLLKSEARLTSLKEETNAIIKKNETRLKDLESELATKEARIKQMLSEQRENTKVYNTTQRRLSTDWITEKDELQTKLIKVETKLITIEAEKKECEAKIIDLEKDIATKDDLITELLGHKRISSDWITERDELQSKLIKVEAKLITLEAEEKDIISEKENQIQHLHSDIAAKDLLIKQLGQRRFSSDWISEKEELQRNLNKIESKHKTMELEKKNLIREHENKIIALQTDIAAKDTRIKLLMYEKTQQKEAYDINLRKQSSELITEKDQLQAKLIKTEAKLIALETEKDEIIYEHENKIVDLESDLAAKDVHIKQLEEALRETSNQKYDEAVSSVELGQLEEKLDKAKRELQHKEDEISKTRNELNTAKDEIAKLKEELAVVKKEIEMFDKQKKDFEANLAAQKKEAGYWEGKTTELETDLQTERKKIDRMRIAHDKDVKNKEAELATLRGRSRVLEQTAGAGAKKVSELRQEFDESVKKLERELATAKRDYDDLTGKYEVLEEEHVVTKARLTVEKENAQGQMLQTQKELNSVKSELKSLQETYNRQTDAWLKEKAELQEEISKLEERLCGGGWEVEKARLTSRLNDSERSAAEALANAEVAQHQLDATRRELEDVKQKLEDYEKIHKVERTYAAEKKEMERHVHILEQKLQKCEQSRRTEVADTKQRLESQLAIVQEETKSLQNQVARFRRERDNYKQMLDAASKSSTAANSLRDKRGSISSCDEEEWRNRVASLEQQISCLEEELCESRAVAAKLKTDMVNERTDFEIQIADLQSKFNEFEEERLVGSGGARIAGAGTRMELAWQKERDKLQRLLRDTATLARDLRHTLFEMERERDKERLESKRRIDQLKKATEEENEENKKKVVELQCDLLELRDAHAKLRTTNEKLRRDRDKLDRDRDQTRQTVSQMKRAHQEDERKINYLIDQIEDVLKLSPELLRGNQTTSSNNMLTPTPPRRNRSKSRSREATPDSDSGMHVQNVQSALTKLHRACEDFKSSRGLERQRQTNMRRAMSTEPREINMTVTPRLSRAPPRSLSLEQTVKDQAAIWKTSVEENSVTSSIQSIETEIDSLPYTMNRDTSMDSRLSGGSTQSDVLPEKKKKKSLLGKLKKFTKSRSIDDQADVHDFKPIGTISQGSDSDMSTGSSKRDIRGRFSDMFRKGNSRASSLAKELSTPEPKRAASAMRPLQSNLSLARSDASINSRAASATPAMRRK